MADYVTKYADQQLEILERRIAAIYRQAQKELGERFRDFMEEHREMDAEMRRQMDEGKITPYKYKKWLKQEVFTGEQWRKKQVAAAKVLTQADRQAAKIINEGTIDVFAEASNFTAYDIEQHVKGTNIDIGGAVSFDIYDQKTVTRLIAEQPELLPRRIVDGVTANAWNQQVIANAVTQGIIQGESIPYLAKRIVRDTGVQSVKTATKYARTAMTGAQNAGRVDRMEEAEEMGIEVKKEWMATNDSKTRDEHGELDGQQRNPDEPFEVNGKKIMFPGDPACPHGELVWNCFVGETTAYTNSEIIRSYKHEYNGELIEIKTAGGVNFTCTPNHPILTLDGWVSAASLNNGDDLLVTRTGNRFGFGRNCNAKHILPSMETFHDAFKRMGFVERNSSLSVNFHGDIPTSEVEIVAQERLLSDNGDSSLSKGVKKFLFKLSDAFTTCRSHLMQRFFTVDIPSFGIMRGSGKALSFFGRCLRHSQKHSLRPIALLDSCGVQSLDNNVSGNIEFISKCLDGFSGMIFADNIIDINKRSGCTHVYNLQTENGYYFVNSIADREGKVNGFAAISHNCRCTLRYIYPKYAHIQKRARQSYKEWKAEKEKAKPHDN